MTLLNVIQLFSIERLKMKTFDEYCFERKLIILEEKLKEVEEIEHPGMVRIYELMTDDKFYKWFQKLPDSILEKWSMYDIYQKFKKEVLKQK